MLKLLTIKALPDTKRIHALSGLMSLSSVLSDSLLEHQHYLFSVFPVGTFYASTFSMFFINRIL